MRKSIQCCCFLLLLLVVREARALDPHKRISQYGHSAWRIEEGYLNTPNTVTQTMDGYIWIGTRSGLFRFDGVRFVSWTPPQGQSLPQRSINSLLGASDGSLWIGSQNSLSHWENGKLVNYVPQPAGTAFGAIIEDHTGTIWATRYHITDGKGPLCKFTGKDLQYYGKEDGIPVGYGLGITEDSAGNIWFGSSMLCRFRPGSSASLYFEAELKHAGGDGVIDVASGPNGSVWAALDGIGPELGVRYYSNGKWSSYIVPGFDGRTVRAPTLFMDRQHSLWIGTESAGLYHIHDGIADHYSIENGLSGNRVGFIYEDREGNLWVVTDGGLDMFRDIPVAVFSTKEGLSSGNNNSILALSDGSVWVGNQGSVDIIPADGKSAVTTLNGLAGQNVGGMFEDQSGRIWLGVGDRLVIYDHDRFFEIKKPDGSPLGPIGTTFAVIEDVDANLWALVGKAPECHLLHIKGLTVEEEIPLDGSIPGARFLAADRQAGIWIASRRDKLTCYRNGHMEIVSLENTDGQLKIYSLFVDSENALWVATNNGLYRLKNGRLDMMGARNGLPCSVVFSVIDDKDGCFWLDTQCGILKISASDLAIWRSDPERKVSVKVFDILDGARPNNGGLLQKQVSRTPDGQLWFVTGRIVQMIDPRVLNTNFIPPPVYIEELVADHKSYQAVGHLNLPPLSGELEIDYTALSYTIPQKVKFRYKLESHDSDWQEPGTRRQAFYNNLPPGNYRFRVIACNNDGVWNEAGATLDFSIAPTWYQTSWFRLLCIITGLFLIWSLYQLRVQQIAKVISARFDERLAERTRIARELHDTFLQTVQGSKIVVDDALEQPDDSVRMHRAIENLSNWLGQATQEARAALNSLHTSTIERNDLAEAFRRAIQDCRMKSRLEASFSVIGQAREMHSIVRDEVYRIGYEAIRNASTHSDGSRLEVELSYTHDLTLRIVDNGIGIDPAILDKGKDEHFGLQGMRERAARIGGKFTIESSATSGTKITVVVPGSIIFCKANSTRSERIKQIFSRFGRKHNSNTSRSH